MLHDISHETPPGSGASGAASSEQLARQQAIRQIERRRRFWFRATAGSLGMAILTVIWAFSEYHNAGGWPTSGFSQSSGIPNVWNYWIIYPGIAWVLLTAADASWVWGASRSPKTRSSTRWSARPVGADRDPRGRRPGAAQSPAAPRWGGGSDACSQRCG